MRVALIGYGEVGRILAEDLREAGHAVAAYDVKLDSDAGIRMRAHAAGRGVTLAASHAEAVASSQLAISAVTAGRTVAAAESCASALPAGGFFLDLNSASPGAKRAAARLVDGAGGRYVEGAVMTSVPPYRIGVPLLIGGPHAAALAPVLGGLGFAARVAGDRLGIASATKMCRSVMIKGLEAMVIESFTAARHHGVEDAVIASLRETFPGIDWEKQAAYFFQRAIEHGRRREEEMREAAATVGESGLEPMSAAGTAARQGWLADLADMGVFGDRDAAAFARSEDWRVEADRMLGRAGAGDPRPGAPKEGR
jgi:3-hydroxyisobutyrate dehydrogenase-like beta-hydroxyacid dehydrogenase